jgi:chromosome segregation ATPase
LELYKKRAHVALKKATMDYKSAHDELQAFHDEVAKLNNQVEELKKQLKLEKEIASQTSVAWDAAKKELPEQVERAVASYKSRMTELEERCQEQEMLLKSAEEKLRLNMKEEQARIHDAEAASQALQNDIERLQQEIHSKSEVAREMLKVKDSEINQLMQTLDEIRSKPSSIDSNNHLPSESSLLESNGRSSDVALSVDVQVLKLARV